MAPRARDIAAVAFVVLLGGATARAGPSLEALMADLQLVPGGQQRPPAFSLETVDGKTVALRDLAGRTILLYFWATW